MQHVRSVKHETWRGFRANLLSVVHYHTQHTCPAAVMEFIFNDSPMQASAIRRLSAWNRASYCNLFMSAARLEGLGAEQYMAKRALAYEDRVFYKKIGRRGKEKRYV